MPWWNALLRRSPFAKLQKQRELCLAHSGLSPALRQLLDVPLPSAQTPLSACPLLVFDFETNGLDAHQNTILSCGSIDVVNGTIMLESARHAYVDDNGNVNAKTAVINHITPEMLREGNPLEDVLDNLFLSMAGKVPVVHGRIVEKQFLDCYVHQRFGLPSLPLLWIDTLEIEKQSFKNKYQHNSDLRLASLRKQYGLPDYPAHHALSDALATAELLLAQIQQNWQGEIPSMGDIASTS